MNEVVRDHTGRVIYTTRNSGGQSQSVYDGHGDFLGLTSPNGTFDERGSRVSQQQAAELLPRKG